MSASSTRGCRAGCPATAGPPVRRWRCASAGTRTSTDGSPPRRSAPAPIFAAACTTRSRTVGIPSGRCFPSAFGMYRRRTACGPVPACAQVGGDRPRGSDRPRPARCSRASRHPRPPHRGSASPASMLRAGRHPCTRGRTAHGTVVPVAAWPPPTAVVGVLALCPRACARRGELGPVLPAMPSRLPPSPSATTAGALPSGRVVLHGHRRYYDPLGLPLRTTRLHLRLIRAALPRRGLRRRVSPVPHRALSTCCAPYPGRTRGVCCSGLPHRERGLRRDMLGSAPALFLCRGGRLHLMLRPALLLPPERLSTPRFGHGDLSPRRGPATGRSGSCPRGTCTRWFDEA